MASNPFDQFDTAGPLVIGMPKPGTQYVEPQAAAQLQSTRTAQEHTTLENRRMQAQAPYDAALAHANLVSAQASAAVAQRKADEAKATDALAAMAPNSNLHGDAYLRAFVPPAMWNTVKAYARGDLGSRSGGLSTSMLPIIQHAMNYDPTTSATNFPARVKMQSDLAGNQPGTAGGSLRAMEQMLLHGANVLTSGQGLNNYGPGLLGTIGNTIRTGVSRLESDPTLNAYEQEVKNYAPESQKAVAGAAGIGQEREERAAGYAASMPQASRAAALQADARMAFERMGAVNDQYKRLMGRDITDQLSPDAKRAYDLIMAGGYGADGKPMYPAAGWRPISGAQSGDGPGTPSGPSGGSAGQALATGPTRLVDDPKAAGIIDALVRRGASADEINAAIAPLGFPGVSQADVARAQAWLKKNPGYTGPIGGAQRQEQTSVLNRFAASPLGTGIEAGVDAALGGTTDEISGVINSAVTGTPLAQTVADANRRKQLAFATNPVSATVGNLAGGTLGYLGAGKLLGGAASALGRAAPYVGSAAYGAAVGFGQNNDHRIGGAAAGAAGGLFGQAAGDLAAIPVGAALRSFNRTGAGRAVNRMFGGAQGAAPLSPAERSAFGAISGAGPDAIQATLADAQRLGVPMTLADTAPSIAELAGAAVRRSPMAADRAEAALLPRGRGQYDRLGLAVARDLGPVGNVPQISEDLKRQARTAAAPLYDAAYAAPAVGSPELESLLATPAGRSALSRAHMIAANERRDPRALGFALDGDGSVVLNPVRADLYSAQASAKAEFDAAQEAYRAARQTPGADMTAAADRITAARAAMRKAGGDLGGAPSEGTAATSRQYSPQTLDYLKRGIDDVIDGLPKGLNGRPIMDENYRAVDGVRRQLLQELDRLNPAYAQARAAYAGPASAREALNLGTDAVTMQPEELSILAANQSPERLAQMQAGFRSELMNRAGNLRDSINPWEAALGSPNARGRVDALYPANPGSADLFRQRELEAQMAATSNRILGNSKTAQRHIADEAFAGSPLPSMVVDAALAAHGGVPVATLARSAAHGKIGDIVKLGLGRRATSKAEELVPMLLNTDPAAAAATVDDLVQRQLAYAAYVRASRPKRLGMFGGAIGGAAGGRM